MKESNTDMNIDAEQFKKLNAFLTYFFPFLDMDQKELNKNNADLLIRYVVLLIDALLKGENLYKKRHMILPDGKVLCSSDTTELMSNITLYLFKFESTIFNFTRTERQTFIFIIENLIDYFRRDRLFADKKDQRNLFMDYRFWIENFLKMTNQKIAGSLYSSNRIHLKNYFGASDLADTELIYSNTFISFSLAPFVVNVNRDNKSKNLFLSRAAVQDGHLVYTDIETETEEILNDPHFDLKVFEFLFSNFEFESAAGLKQKLKNQHIKHILVEHIDAVEKASNFHQERLFFESFSILQNIPFETLEMPMVYLLQVKNLISINRLLEVKNLLEKFVSLFPYYSEGFEILGDIFLKEEDYETALSHYEKVLKFTQNKRVAEKLKRVRDMIERNKQQVVKEKNDGYFDITEIVFHSDEKMVIRKKELRQLIEVLLADTRRNALLVGDSGVGKSSLIRLLAMKMLNREVPEALKDKRLKEINFVSLLMGSKYRGQFEEKVVKILGEFKGMNAILVLEDVHLMMSSGAPRGASLDLINMLKPYLKDKSIQVIASTSYEEYKNNIEKDNTLMGFFQKITVNEMSADQTRLVIKNLSEQAFSKEKIIVPNEILDYIIESARRDVRDKKCPDSAVMIFERIIARLKYRNQMEDINRLTVDTNDVSDVVMDMLNLPESNLPISLKQRLAGLKQNLLHDIIGQDEAIERVVANVITAKMDFDIKKGRPDGVFLFIGPTGVGKTETAIALSRALYGSEDHLVRIDMSEYMEKFTYSRFVGAAPGYVGYMDANQLTDKVRQNPHSIILLDEIEKADSQLLNIFLQVFDAGRLTDARGNVADFSHTTIIMTSNIGTSLFSRTDVGYQSDFSGAHVSHSSLLKALKKYFSPEFLNRLDDVLIFNHLQESHIEKIIDIQLRVTREQLAKHDKILIIGNDVMDFIIRNGYSKEYGARHLGRTIRKEILEKLALLSLEQEWDEARQITCSMDLDNAQVTVRIAFDPPFPDKFSTVEEPGFFQEFNIENL